ncbi:MAG TPA: type IX secretion system membrane protein PorP/SprF [Chitinophagales bacterium]|nr:type IX secretion system membrane protein PorP/SprF [Chitinophagales bacterium]
MEKYNASEFLTQAFVCAPAKRIASLAIAIFLLAIALPASAQQIPIFSLYHENGFVLNPGITGYEGMGIAAVSYRHQWTKVEESPRTVSGGYRMPIYSKGDLFQKAGNFIGVGAYVMNDKTGPTSYLSGNITFAYHISFAKINPFNWAAFLRKSHLSFGLTASINQYRLNSTELIPEMANDRLVIAADDSKILPNAGLGMYYYYDKFYFGVSVPQVVPLKVKYAESDAASTIHKINHVFIVTGGKIPFGGKVAQTGRGPRKYTYKFYLEPMVWFKKVSGAPYQYDAYLRFRHKDLLWLGAGYRSSKTVVIDAGILIKKQVKFGYAYDLTVSDLSSYLGGSHEVVLAYQIDFGNRYRR